MSCVPRETGACHGFRGVPRAPAPQDSGASEVMAGILVELLALALEGISGVV